MIKAYRFRIYPTDVQQQTLRMQLGSVHFVYNYFLALQQERYENKKKHLSFFDLCRELVELKRSGEYSWLYLTYAQSWYQGLKNLDVAYQNFFRQRSGPPQFKSRRYGHQSMAYPQGSFLDGNHLHVPKLVDDGKPLPKPLQEFTLVSGVDLGLKAFATVASATETTQYANPSFYTQHLPKLRRTQRSLSRRMQGSHRYRQQRKKVAQMHETVANARQDYLHQLSTQLVSENQAVIVENLNVRGLVKNRRLAKHIADVAWGEFVRQLAYKCQWAGKHLVSVDRFYPSSKTCYECSVKNEELTLNDRAWTCASCGVDLNRDGNAAQNIRAEGMYQLTAARCVFDNRGEDVRLGLRSALVLLRSIEQTSAKRVGWTAESRPELAQISN